MTAHSNDRIHPRRVHDAAGGCLAGHPFSRRRLLSTGAGAVGAAVGGSLLPRRVQQALALPPRAGGLDAIEHVVIFMQENRAFDHYFGTMRGVRGFADPAAMTLRSGDPIFAQPRGTSPAIVPYLARAAAEAAGRPVSDAQFIDSLDHGWKTGHQAWAGGWYDDWVAAKTAATMAHYDRHDLRFYFALADTFTVCDAYFGSVLGPTNPNRMYLWSGTVGYEPGSDRRAIENDATDKANHPGYDWTTYPERLEQAGISWQIYSEWDNFDDNPLEFFATFKAIVREALAEVDGGFTTLHQFYERAYGAAAAQQRALLDQLAAGVARLDPAKKRLYDRGLRRVDLGKLVDTFRADVEAGRLPRVSYIITSSTDSEHPCCSSPDAGAAIASGLLDALAADPEIWASSVFLLVFDENDGYFDHIPPPVPPPEITEEYHAGEPIGLGVRVPMVVISPWTADGAVCSQVFDHTSVIQFLERWLDVAEPNISQWRRSVCGDLTAAFDFSAFDAPASLPQAAAALPPGPRWQPEPPSARVMPGQEPGARPARPLPYQPDVTASLDRSSGTLTLIAANTGTASVHLAVYPFAAEFDAPVHLDVPAGGASTLAVRVSRYHLTVSGPNGFLRTFQGDGSGIGAGASASSQIDPRTRDIALTLGNEDNAAPVTFLATSRLAPDGAAPPEERLEVPPGESTLVRFATANGWYDITITLDEAEGFVRRMAGHIEDGKQSVSG